MPCPVQAIKEAVCDESDVLGAAQTGSGKTLAFGLPILHHALTFTNRFETSGKGAVAARAAGYCVCGLTRWESRHLSRRKVADRLSG